MALQVSRSSGRPQQSGEPVSRAAAGDEPAEAHLVESRALVPVEPTVSPESRTAGQGRCYAPFLAQLIATREHMAQTREKRRAEPAEAMAVYRSAVADHDRPLVGESYDA